MTTRRIAFVALAALGVVVFTGCGDSSDSSSSSPIDAATTLTSDTTLSESSGSTDQSGSTTEAAESGDSRLERAKDALAAGDFSTMLELLELSGLAGEIEEREVTILAPTEEAFSELSSDDITDLLANPTQIDDILKRHVIEGVLTFDELAAMSEVTTLSGDVLVVSGDGGSVTVDGAVVSEPSSESLSGAEGQEISVLGIDRVLLDGQ